MTKAKQKKNLKIPAYEGLKQLKMNARPADKKSSIIKDISKVLTEIEDIKKSRKIIYFSTLQGKAVIDSNKRKIGKLKDLAISGGERFPEISHLLVSVGKNRWMIPWKYVASFNKELVLDRTFEKIDKREKQEDDVFLGHNILDKQVVDVNGLKVIRVNDIALTFIKNKLAVVHIDVGTRAMLRRLGLGSIADRVSWFNDHPVAWGSVEPLAKNLEKIHLKVPCGRVSDLHPADVAELFDELSMTERKILLRSMKREKAAKVILECEPDVRSSIIKSIRSKRLAPILEKMPANDAANLLSELDYVQRDRVLKRMDKDKAAKVQEMLAYQSGTAARYMSSTFVVVNQEATVSDALDFIRGLEKKPENFYYVYIKDENDSLVGVISLKNLIISKPESMLRDVMVSKLVTVDISDPIEYVEDVISKYDLLSLPVRDINHKIRGVVNIDEILDLIVERTKKNEPFELTDKEKKRLREDKRVIDIYKGLFKDIGQLVKEAEPSKFSGKKLK